MIFLLRRNERLECCRTKEASSDEKVRYAVKWCKPVFDWCPYRLLLCTYSDGNQSLHSCDGICLSRIVIVCVWRAGLTGLPVSKMLLCWSADKKKIILCQPVCALCTITVCFGQSNDLKRTMMWLSFFRHSLSIKLCVLNWCHASYVLFTIPCREAVPCCVVTALKDPWRSNNLHQIFFI